MKKAICVVLVLVMMLSISLPAMASQSNEAETFIVSDTIHMKITYESKDASRNSIQYTRGENAIETDFIIEQFYDDELIQTVSGSIGGFELVVINYMHGKVTTSEVVQISDRVTRHGDTLESSATVQDEYSLTATSVGSPIGYITYNPREHSTVKERVRVYSRLDKNDNEAYTIKGKKTDTLSLVAGTIMSVIGAFIPGGVAMKIATAIVSALGGSLVAKEIGIAFSEPVAVNAYYYTLTAYSISFGTYSGGKSGVARRVTTKSSPSYDEWLYELYTPKNWKDNVLAYWFWGDLFGDFYPGVASYS